MSRRPSSIHSNVRFIEAALNNPAVRGDPDKIDRVLARQGHKSTVWETMGKAFPNSGRTNDVVGQAAASMDLARKTRDIAKVRKPRTKADRSEAARRAAKTRKARGGGR